MADEKPQIGPQANLQRADLSERDLRSADLTGADLTEANLSRADLIEANLSRANMSRGNLSGTDLTKAHLAKADLTGADLTRAYLTRAGLTGAYLDGADLTKAHLDGADLTNAHLTKAKLIGADLTKAKLIGADLTGADLTGADLTGADLDGADLDGADLTRANLTGTKSLTRTNLNRANLAEADLTGADLTGANLIRASLKGAKLNRASLIEANLNGANLNGANLTRATFGSTVFPNIDLRDVIGLDEAHHIGPSTVGVDTLYLSEGRIPEVFLRGCGLPDYFVGLVPGLTVTAPIQHFSAFISYSHADGTLARVLYDHLFHRKKVPIWLDEHEIEAGDLIMKSVDQAIRRMDKVVLLCSEASLNSWWVREEIERWTDRERELSRKEGESVSMVIPIDLDGYLWECDHEYAATIKKAKVVDAKGWEDDTDLQASVSSQLHRALKLDRRTPLQMMQDQAAELPDDDLR